MNETSILIIGDDESQPLTFHTYTKKHLDNINKIAPQAKVTLVPNKKKEIDAHIGNAQILLAPHLDNVDLKKATSLEWVHVTSAGVNSAIKALKKSEILLTNSSGVHPIPIAEHVFAYLLMFARGFNTFYKTQVIKHEWDAHEPDSIFELSGKTIGIVGFGRIGERIAHVAKGFDMHVLACSTSHRYFTDADSWYTTEQLPHVLEQSDFVINCLPLTDATHHMFNTATFGVMKPTAYFVNIGRGGTVDEKALITALKNKTIAGAGLDVFEVEPLPKTSPLWQMENVIITPHDAGRTPKYMERVIRIFCSNLRFFLGGREMPNLIDKERGY